MIRLAPFTFLNGPNGVGKTTIAERLLGEDAGLMMVGFAEPIRMALLATFYPDQLTFGINLRDSKVKESLIPGTGITHRKWMISYGQWLRELLGPNIYGDLAKRTVEANVKYFDRYIFEDTRFIGDLAPFVNAFGGRSCLIVHVRRHGFDFTGADQIGGYLTVPGVRHVSVDNNGSIDDAMQKLAAALHQTYKKPRDENYESGLDDPSQDEPSPYSSSEPSVEDL